MFGFELKIHRIESIFSDFIPLAICCSISCVLFERNRIHGKRNLNAEFRAKNEIIPLCKCYYATNQPCIQYYMRFVCCCAFIACHHLAVTSPAIGCIIYTVHIYWTRTCIDCIKCLITMHNNSIRMKIANRQIII